MNKRAVFNAFMVTTVFVDQALLENQKVTLLAVLRVH